MNNSTTRTQQIIRHTLTLAMSVCFIAAGWLLLKPLVRPASAEAATTSALPWTTKAIEEVAVGDLVLARDEHGTALGWKPVKEVYRRTSYHLRHLTFRDAAGHEQTFETTDEHPFWSVTEKKFINAGDLATGDRVVSVPSHTASDKTPISVNLALVQTLTATHRDEHPAGITVYNFQVEDFHTYFVAARGATGPPVLVHNADHFYGNDKPWLSGATPNSVYTHIDPKTGKAVQNAIYDSNGNVIAHVDFKNHGGAVSGHGHQFPPGQPGFGHGQGAIHYPPGSLPPDYSIIPPSVAPHTPLGQ